MRRWLLLGLLLFSQRLLQPHTLPGVVLPMQQLLLVDELGTLGVHQLLPEVLILQELQHVQAVGVSAGKDKRGVTPSVSAIISHMVHWMCLIRLIKFYFVRQVLQ